MRTNSRANPALLLLSILLLGIFALHLHGQVQTVPGGAKPKQPWHAITIIPIGGDNDAADIFTVPNKRELVITDLVASNSSGTNSFVRLIAGGEVRFGTILVPANGTISHTFGSGVVFGPGETVTISNPGVGGSSLLWSLHGYLRKG